MVKFCGRCGLKLNKKTGNCPKCDKQLKKANKKQESVKLTVGQRIRKLLFKLFLSVFFFLIIVGGILALVTYYHVVEIPIISEVFDNIGFNKYREVEDEEDMLESYKVPAPDAESYYEENSKIVSKIDANDSKEVYTEAEIVTFLTSRNLTKYPIITQYSMDGTYYNEIEISDVSSEKHPMYQTYYVTESGDLWIVYLINNAIMATPISYNMQSDLETELVISETNTVTSYDSITNKFYETIPNKSELIVIPVDKINAETLEQLTIGEIDTYVQNEM